VAARLLVDGELVRTFTPLSQWGHGAGDACPSAGPWDRRRRGDAVGHLL